MNPTASAAAWMISAGQATNLLAGPRSRIDLDHPGAGIEVWRDAAQPERLLGIDLGATCERLDAWSRGGDITAVYEPVGGVPLRVTAMWRAAPPWRDPGTAADAWCREVIVSAQTPLLEATPRIAVTVDVAGETATPVTFRSGGLAPATTADASPQGFLVPGPRDQLLVFLVHPADARTIDVESARGRVRIHARLFPTALEKGVLLRSRALAALGPVERDAIPAWAQGLACGFAASAPMLTT